MAAPLSPKTPWQPINTRQNHHSGMMKQSQTVKMINTDWDGVESVRDRWIEVNDRGKGISRNKREDNAEVGQSAGEVCLSQISRLLPARERDREWVR